MQVHKYVQKNLPDRGQMVRYEPLRSRMHAKGRR
jgi:hypothetical protein